MTKILEIITEPDKITVGSTFKLKVKAIRHIAYEELKAKTYNQIKQYTYNELKGV